MAYAATMGGSPPSAYFRDASMASMMQLAMPRPAAPTFMPSVTGGYASPRTPGVWMPPQPQPIYQAAAPGVMMVPQSMQVVRRPSSPEAPKASPRRLARQAPEPLDDICLQKYLDQTPSLCSSSCSKSQVELNAESKLKTIMKLQEDAKALDRKASNLARTSKEARAANDLKNQRVVDHCQRKAAQTEARRRQLEKSHSERRDLVTHRRNSERDRWECWNDNLNKNLSDAARWRQLNQEATNRRIEEKMRRDDQALERKAQNLRNETRRCSIQSEIRQGKVDMHNYYQQVVQDAAVGLH